MHTLTQAMRGGAALLLCALALGCGVGTSLAQTPAAPTATDEQEEIPAETRAHLDRLQKELNAAEAAGNAKRQAQLLTHIGSIYFRLSDAAKELDAYQRALPLFRGAGDRLGEAHDLNNMALAYGRLGHLDQSLDHSRQSAALCRELNDRRGEAIALEHIGSIYSQKGDRESALETFEVVLGTFRDLKDRHGEANVLRNIGLVKVSLGQVQEGIDLYLNEALPIFRDLDDRRGQAGCLNNAGLAYHQLGRMQESLKAFEQALQLYEAIKYKRGEASAFENAASVLSDLGRSRKALEWYTLAEAIYVKIGDPAGEAVVQNNMGQAHGRLGETAEEIACYEKALTLYQKSENRNGEAKPLNNLGTAYMALGQNERALENYNKALPLYEQVGDHNGHAMALGNIGYYYAAKKDAKRAEEFYGRAWSEAAIAGNPLLEYSICRKLMLFDADTKPGLAIFFGKLAVNFLQTVRGNMEGLSQGLQSGFLQTKQDVFHELADLLIAQNRLPEAQQVLDLLKRKEYSDYVRGESEHGLEALSLTPEEKSAQAEYEQSTAKIVSLGEQWAQLKRISTRTPDEEMQYQQLADQLDRASKGLNDYYARLYLAFGKNNEANKKLADVKGNVSLLRQTIAKLPHTVAIYTLVGQDRVSEIVITGSAVVARQSSISEKDLSRKVSELQQALREPSRDVKPIARGLYDVLIAPVKADLDQAKAETLIWSLDGVLRYVPLAALYDGKQFLVERYSTATITPASIARLADKPAVGSLSVAAMGISGKFEATLPALPAVVGELNEVVNDPRVQSARGTLPGTMLLDGQFTEKAMEQELSGQHPVVHIASHFVFKPGDDGESYLLLAGKDVGGEGYHLTVAEFRDNQKLDLDGADLLTLSACDTGMSGSASNGREVDGLGTTAQLKGAKAVLSSLWEVNDSSTSLLMSDFYRRWAAGGGKLTKVEALRQAQLDLLLGQSAGDSGAAGRGLEVPIDDPSRNLAHPYYWAPFVLMGNWL